MKRYLFSLFLLAILFSVSACSDDDLGPSIFDTSEENLTGLDLWMRDNYVKPYNIEVIYKWTDIESDMAATLIPPTEENAGGLADALKNIWCTPYVNIAGKEFFCKLAPKQLMFIGSSRYNTDGTVTKGSAEGGRKIIIYEVNQFDMKNATRLKRYMKTIHHEFAHIANQTIELPKEYELISTDYVEQWKNMTDQQAYDAGFISPYAMSEPSEDFAEMVGIMLSNNKTAWEALLNKPANQEAKDKLQQKLEMVLVYYRDIWNVDLYALQDECEKAIDDLVKSVN